MATILCGVHWVEWSVRLVSTFSFLRLVETVGTGPFIDPASCLIVDIRMPEMDGFELHALLEASGRDVPTIFTSAHDDRHYVARSKSAGGAALLNKSHVMDSLHDAILKAIAKQH